MIKTIVTITKKELATYLGVSNQTLKKWLNVKYYDDLKALGYDRNQRVIMPGQLKWLQEKLGFNLNESNLIR